MTTQQQREAFERFYLKQHGREAKDWGYESQIAEDAFSSGARWQAAQQVPVGHIPMPKSAEEARAMALAGEAWLRTNAPEELRPPPAQQVPEGWKIEKYPEGISVYLPNSRGGIHLTDGPHNSIVHVVLRELCAALLTPPDSEGE